MANPNGGSLPIGIQGEYNIATRIIFPGIASDTPDCTVVLLHKRKGDELPYEVQNFEVVGTDVVWTVDRIDTGITGYGELEMQFYDVNGLAKSKVWETKVARGIGTMTEAPPDPYIAWYDKMAAESAKAKTSANEAAESAAAAGNSAASASTSATEAGRSAGAAAEAATNAGQAAGAAADAATEAGRSAGAAAEAATEAGRSAGAAAEAATNAGQAAGVAAEAATNAGQAAGAAAAAAQTAVQKKTEVDAAAGKALTDISTAKSDALSAISARQSLAETDIVTKTNEQLERIPEVTALAEDVADIKNVELPRLEAEIESATPKDYDAVKRDVYLLKEAAKGNLYAEVVDDTAAQSKDVPNGAITADLDYIGGCSRDIDGLIHAPTEEVVTRGKNLIDPKKYYKPFNYDTQSLTVDGSGFYRDLFQNTTGTGGSHIITDLTKVLYLPTGTYTISIEDAVNGALRLFRVNANGICTDVGALTSNSSITFTSNGEHFTLRRTSNYTATFRNIMVEKADIATPYSPYVERRTEIPPSLLEFLADKGYGQSNADKVNTLNFEDKKYHQQGYYNADGVWVDSINRYDISEYLPDNFEWLDIEEGGTVEFVYADSDKYKLPVPNQITYAVKTVQ